MTSPVNMTLYRLLLKMGGTEEEAEAAARSDTSDLATKADLLAVKADVTAAISEMKADLLKWSIGIVFTALGLQTALLLFAFSRMSHP
jgi:hypothetical protein